VEPEGRDTCEIYVNGFSSSLPEDVQYKALKRVAGFENMKMFRPGYAIEYDFFQPTQLNHSLETKNIHNLYFAGQINGTTGYEEAGSQGLMAGINAAQNVKDEEPFILSRADAYIGVLIDDLVNKGTKEPYRMFTSRAEFRILLRQDNADLRLTPLAYKLGISEMDERMDRVTLKKKAIEKIDKYFLTTSVSPDDINNYLISKNSAPLSQKVKLKSVLSRPDISITELKEVLPDIETFIKAHNGDTIESAEITIKYEGYIKKEQEMVDKMKRLEKVSLQPDFEYAKILALSAEAREKLASIRPRSIGQASRISGVSPSDISVLLVHIGR
jgi:tRNA uridine 5-carboxymethylaminomethyl modification enzyme